MPLHGKIVVIKRGGTDGVEFPLSASCTFGRKPDCDIRIQIPHVSKEHCRIDLNENKEVILTNLSSVNPTRVNGEVLQQAERLKHGDVITIIDRSFRFEYPPAPTPRKNSSTSGKPKTLKVLQDPQLVDAAAADTGEKRVSEVFTDGTNQDNIQRSLEKAVEMEPKEEKTTSPFGDLYQMIKKSLEVKTPRKYSTSLLQTPSSTFCTPKACSVRKENSKLLIATEDKGTPKKDDKGVASGTPKSLKKQRASFPLSTQNAAADQANATRPETTPHKRNRSTPQKFSVQEVVEQVCVQLPKSPNRRRSKEATPAKPTEEKVQEHEMTSKTKQPQRVSPRNSGKAEKGKEIPKKRKSTDLATGSPTRQKKKRVSFGGHLSPELFDKRLPPDSPLRKGAAPRRSLCVYKPKQSLLRRASVIGLVKEHEQDDLGGKNTKKKGTPSPKKSESAKNASPKTPTSQKKMPKSRSPSPKTASPGKKSPKSKSPSPKSGKTTPNSRSPSPKVSSQKAKTPSPKGASAGKETPKSRSPSPKAASLQGNTPKSKSSSPKAASPKTPVRGRSPSTKTESPKSSGQPKTPKSGTPRKAPVKSASSTPTLQGRFSVSRISTPSPLAEDAVTDQVSVTPKIPLRRKSMKSTSRKTPSRKTPSYSMSALKVMRRSGISRASLKAKNSWAEIVKFGQAKAIVVAPTKILATKKRTKKAVPKPQTPARKLVGHVSTGHADSPMTIVVGKAHKRRVLQATGAAPRLITNIAHLKKNMKMDEDLTGISEMFKTPVNERKRKSVINVTETPIEARSTPVVEPSVLKTPEEPGEMMVSPLTAVSTARQFNCEAVQRLLNEDQESSFISDIPVLEIEPECSDEKYTDETATPIRTPKQKPEQPMCLTGVKRIMKTPRHKAEPLEDLRGKILKTPKQKPEQKECLTGVKRIMKTPKQKAEPIEDLRGKILATPKQKAEQGDCLSGVKRMLRTPRQRSESVEDIRGNLLVTPKQKPEPKECLTGVKTIFDIPQWDDDDGAVEDLHEKLLNTPKAEDAAETPGSHLDSLEAEDQVSPDCDTAKEVDSAPEEPQDTAAVMDNLTELNVEKESSEEQPEVDTVDENAHEGQTEVDAVAVESFEKLPEVDAVAAKTSLKEHEVDAVEENASEGQPEVDAVPVESPEEQPELDAVPEKAPEEQPGVDAVAENAFEEQPEEDASEEQPEEDAVAKDASEEQPEEDAVAKHTSEEQPEEDAVAKHTSEEQPEEDAVAKHTYEEQPEEDAVAKHTYEEQPEEDAVAKHTYEEQPLVEAIAEKAFEEQLGNDAVAEKTFEELPEEDAVAMDASEEQPLVEVITAKASEEQPEVEVIAEKASEEQPEVEVIAEKASEEQPEVEVIAEKASEEQPEVDAAPENATEEQQEAHAEAEMASEEQPEVDAVVQNASEEQLEEEITEMNSAAVVVPVQEKRSVRGRRAKAVEAKGADATEKSEDLITPAPIRGRRGKKTETTAPPAIRQTRNRNVKPTESQNTDVSVEETAPEPCEVAVKPKRGRNVKKTDQAETVKVAATEPEVVSGPMPQDDKAYTDNDSLAPEKNAALQSERKAKDLEPTQSLPEDQDVPSTQVDSSPVDMTQGEMLPETVIEAEVVPNGAIEQISPLDVNRTADDSVAPEEKHVTELKRERFEEPEPTQSEAETQDITCADMDKGETICCEEEVVPIGNDENKPDAAQSAPQAPTTESSPDENTEIDAVIVQKKSGRGRRGKILETNREAQDNTEESIVTAAVRGRRGKKAEAPAPVRQTTRTRNARSQETSDKTSEIITEISEEMQPTTEISPVESPEEKETPVEEAVVKPMRGRKAKQAPVAQSEPAKNVESNQASLGNANQQGNESVVKEAAVKPVRGRRAKQVAVEPSQSEPEKNEDASDQISVTASQDKESLPEVAVIKPMQGRRAKQTPTEQPQPEPEKNEESDQTILGNANQEGNESTVKEAVVKPVRGRRAKQVAIEPSQPEPENTKDVNDQISVSASQDDEPLPAVTVLKPVRGRRVKETPIEQPQPEPEKTEVDEPLMEDPLQPTATATKPRRGRKLKPDTVEQSELTEQATTSSEIKQESQPPVRAKRGRNGKLGTEKKESKDGEVPAETSEAQTDEIVTLEEAEASSVVESQEEINVTAKPKRGRKTKQSIDSETAVQEMPVVKLTEKSKRGRSGKDVAEEEELSTVKVPEDESEIQPEVHDNKIAEPNVVIAKPTRGRGMKTSAKNEVSQVVPAKRARRGAASLVEDANTESIAQSSSSVPPSAEPVKRGRRAAAKPTTDEPPVSSDEANPSDVNGDKEDSKMTKRSIRWKSDVEVFNIPQPSPVKSGRVRKTKLAESNSEEKDLSGEVVEVQPVKKARRGPKVTDVPEPSSTVDPKRDAEVEVQPKTRRGRSAKK